MEKRQLRKIVLEDGTEFYGNGFGFCGESVGEIVFNTSMAGYQEIISNSAYMGKILLLTYPLIGNYGIVEEDCELKNPLISGLIVRSYSDTPSNFRYTKTLCELLEESQIPAIEGIDTRMLFKKIRDGNVYKAMITNADTPNCIAVERLRETELEKNLAKKISCKKRWYSRTSWQKYNVIVIDCGIKKSEVKALNLRSCNVTVMPWSVNEEEIAFLKPDGIYISDGPEKAEDAFEVIELVKKLKGKFPIGGTGLGCQIIACAFGAHTEKMRLGHNGSNHPIKDLTNGKVENANQSHLYTINKESLKKTHLDITHINLLDETIEGISSSCEKIIGVAFQPSINNNSVNKNFYDEFINMMKGAKGNA